MVSSGPKHKCRMWVSLAIQLTESFVASTVTEEHGAYLGGRPPHENVGCPSDHVLRQNLNFRRLPQFGNQRPQHVLRQQLRRTKPDIALFVGHVVHSNE